MEKSRFSFLYVEPRKNRSPGNPKKTLARSSKGLSRYHGQRAAKTEGGQKQKGASRQHQSERCIPNALQLSSTIAFTLPQGHC